MLKCRERRYSATGQVEGTDASRRVVPFMNRDLYLFVTLFIFTLLLGSPLIAPVAPVTAQCANGDSGNNLISCVDVDPPGTSIDGNAGNDTILFENIDTGDAINGGDGDDSIAVNNSEHVGTISGGDGNDTIKITSSSVGGNIEGGDGNDSILVTNGSFVDGTIFGDNGDDLITVDGDSTVDRSVRGGEGDDLITNNGTIGIYLEGNEGNDTLYNGSSGIAHYILGGGDNDYIVNDGVVNEDIEGNAGDDTIINNHRVNDEIDGDSGNDLIINNGIVMSDIDGGTGDDTIINNAGASASDLFGAPGDDVIYNYGNVANRIMGQDGNDLIINHSVVGNHIEGGEGNDTVQIVGDGASVAGLIDGGDDWDVLEFHFSTTNVSEKNNFMAALALENASSGSITWRGNTYYWQNFEQLLAFITLIQQEAAQTGETFTVRVDKRLNWMDPAAPVAVYCEAGNIHVYGIQSGGVGVFSVGETMAALLAGETVSGEGVSIFGGETLISVVANGYQFDFDPALCAIPAV